MSEITYVCPFRKEVYTTDGEHSFEYFMPCDFERCSLCSVGESSTSTVYFCDYPSSQKGWEIKRIIKQF